uniref:Uncharacterized protein n=1 Tax=Oryza nivara TaxID=4536 RepID=A0A0E0HEG8_ORYNI
MMIVLLDKVASLCGNMRKVWNDLSIIQMACPLQARAATDPFFKSAFSRATSMPGFAAEEDEHQDDQPSLVTQMFFSIG